MALSQGNISDSDFTSLRTQSQWSIATVGVMQYDQSRVKEHIKKFIKNSKNNSYQGVEALKKAAEDGLLRKGQVIFGTVSIAHHKGEEDPEGRRTRMGWLYNTLTPFILGIMKGQSRGFAYLHASVYAGKHEGVEYVIENGGANPSTGIGTIDLSPLDDAFEPDASFFIVSPPKDPHGQSTRYLVLQRALACLGLNYIYNMRAVSCETFATALFGLLDDDYFAPLQIEVLRSHKMDHPDIDGQRSRDILKFKQFYSDLCEQIEQVPEGVILTLKYFINQPRKKRKVPWFQQMTDHYINFIKAAERGDSSGCLALLELGLNPEGREAGGDTAVNVAAAAGHWDTVTALVTAGAVCGEDIVKSAVAAEHWDTVTALVKAGAEYRDLLMLAAEEGRTDTVMAVIAGVAGTERDGMLGTALKQAAHSGHTDTVMAVIAGVTGTQRDDMLGTALREASKGGHIDTVLALIAAGANTEHWDTDGRTALFWAAWSGHTDTVLALIAAGANIEHQDTYGSTALIWAAGFGHTDTVLALIAAGANIEHQATDSNTALIWAARFGRTDTVKALTAAGANIEHQNTYGSTALIWAARNGERECVVSLVAAGADIHHRDNSGDTALSVARLCGRGDVVKLLERAAEGP